MTDLDMSTEMSAETHQDDWDRKDHSEDESDNGNKHLIKMMTGDVCQGKQRKMSCDLMKPFSEGWVRECLVKNGTVKNVYYLTPVSGTNNKRRRIRCKSNLVQLRSVYE